MLQEFFRFVKLVKLFDREVDYDISYVTSDVRSLMGFLHPKAIAEFYVIQLRRPLNVITHNIIIWFI
jgi:hypothetical protein